MEQKVPGNGRQKKGNYYCRRSFFLSAFTAWVILTLAARSRAENKGRTEGGGGERQKVAFVENSALSSGAWDHFRLQAAGE